MIRSKSNIQFNTHHVTVCIDEHEHIHVFKYHNRSCDFEVFTDQNEASDYIMTPPPSLHYRVVVSGDDE